MADVFFAAPVALAVSTPTSRSTPSTPCVAALPPGLCPTVVQRFLLTSERFVSGDPAKASLAAGQSVEAGQAAQTLPPARTLRTSSGRAPMFSLSSHNLGDKSGMRTKNATLPCNTNATAEQSNRLRWLERYAAYCALPLDPTQPVATTLRQQFTARAWRLLCRSPKSAFIPILRCQRLSFDSLVRYAQTLVDHGFQTAPEGRLLAYFITSSYFYFDSQPGVPSSADDLTLLRLASRHGPVPLRELQLAHLWSARNNPISKHMTWASVFRRVQAWQDRLQASLIQERWHFACRATAWRGLDIVPLESVVDLWDEGHAMASCLYGLRSECTSSQPSRFFSVRKDGRRYATLELVRKVPDEAMHGPDRLYGQWQLQDCRLSHNRLPPEALVQSLQRFAWQFNVLAQRPSRNPQRWNPPPPRRGRSMKPSQPWQPVPSQATKAAQVFFRPQGSVTPSMPGVAA